MQPDPRPQQHPVAHRERSGKRHRAHEMFRLEPVSASTPLSQFQRFPSLRQRNQTTTQANSSCLLHVCSSSVFPLEFRVLCSNSNPLSLPTHLAYIQATCQLDSPARRSKMHHSSKLQLLLAHEQCRNRVTGRSATPILPQALLPNPRPMLQRCTAFLAFFHSAEGGRRAPLCQSVLPSVSRERESDRRWVTSSLTSYPS